MQNTVTVIEVNLLLFIVIIIELMCVLSHTDAHTQIIISIIMDEKSEAA